jgi:hypothetical protein
MRADYRVVLDACVLIPMPLADTLLRMAEAPRLYLPKWSQTIMDEVSRTLIESWVQGFEPLIDLMTNNAGDRHVLAAAVYSHSELVVTYNLRHFPDSSVRSWEIEVQGPSTFLRGLYNLDAGLVVSKLHEQAAAIGITLPQLLGNLSKNVPGFVRYFGEEQGIELLG